MARVAWSSATPDWTDPSPTEEPVWFRLWSIVVFVLVGLEIVLFDGPPASPDGAPWFEGRGPLVLVGASVLVLLLLAAIQAKWSKSGGWEGSNVGRLGLGSCPAWFEYAAVGLATVGFVGYAYAGIRSFGSDGAVHAVERRAAFLLMLGSYFCFELIAGLSGRNRRTLKRRRDESA